ncbi:GMC oxidoreductase [Popillia japonica]|uniref:GMC oxidoreductase n=1 Tax=Popillia japonica TaxID=7064 RepID=A0AAW1N005_POPJA
MIFLRSLLIQFISLQLLSSAYGIIPLDYCANLEPFQQTLNVAPPPNFSTRLKDLRTVPTAPTVKNEYEEEFDFVIVGSGPAGSVIANRLTENSNWTVLLLEIGEVPINTTEIVAIANSFQMSDYNWGYLMEPQDNAGLGLNDRLMNWPRGKVLGGSSTISACVHSRGNRKDYDRWSEAGNPGWSFEDVLPYFKKSEDFLVQIQDPEYHSQGGLLGVQDVPYRSGSSEAFVQAALEFGYEYIDYNGREQVGVSFSHGTMRRGRRSAAFNAFLEPFSYRENLKIYTGARATEVLIDHTTKRAHGVRYDKDNEYHIVRARKEVILSAGSFNSPQLLMLSGVGPKDHLEQLQIPVIQDLPGVGQNMVDHAIFYGITFTLNESIAIPFDQIGVNEQVMEDFLNGEGILTTLTGAEALAHIKTPYTIEPDPTIPDVVLIFVGAEALAHIKTPYTIEPDPTIPDVVLIFVGTSNNANNGTVFKELVNVRDDIYDAIWGQIPDGAPAVSIVPMLYHPQSIGYLRLKSNSPYDVPLFYGNFFTDLNNDDIKVLTSSIRVIQELLTMPAWQRYDAQLIEPKIPGCEAYRYDTDEFWECLLRHIGATANHQVGTCKMGPDSDPDAVVGADLRVHGISGLRVADTSIMPGQVAAHTAIPTFMIGEKAADMIKESWG